MKISLKKATRDRVFKLKAASLGYFLVFIGAVWALAFALTGSMFRGTLATLALVIAYLTYRQSRIDYGAAEILGRLPYMKEFDEEMKKE